MAHFIALAEVRKQCSLPGNPRNRLVEITDAERTTALYGHNYKGQRVTKAMGQRAQHFIYNQFNQLIAEANDQGVIEKEYLYLGLTPIAHIQVADEAVYYHHNDHLRSVQAISDAQQNILWRAHCKPFGAIEQVEGQGENNWRFPGQYADQESGYYYNYFRDYDPSLGRYLQSDPIGLNGGINSFAYVRGNPILRYDPHGLLDYTGEEVSASLVRGIGGYSKTYRLTSPAVNNMRAHITVRATGFGYGFYGSPFSTSVGQVTFGDPFEFINPDGFNGKFVTAGSTFATPLGWGKSAGITKLGSMWSTGTSTLDGG